MTTFKKGAKVRCVRASTVGYAGEPGELFTVAVDQVSAGSLSLVGHGMKTFDASRFEPYVEDVKPAYDFRIRLNDGSIDSYPHETLEAALEVARLRFGDTAQFDVVKVHKVASFKVSKVVEPA
jgi:hypothetical protein